MNNLDIHALALQFCRQHQPSEVVTIEAAMQLAALLVTEHMITEIRTVREALDHLHECDRRGWPAAMKRHD